MKKLAFFVTLISVIGFCHAQNSPTDYPEVVPPPPSAASLMRFEEVPVDYYTGQPNIALSFGNVSINKDLLYPIALRYNTQGIRVDERSGWTGTGFSMATGGTITRTIKGLPDELNTPLKGTGIYFNPYYNFDILNSAQEQEFLWNSAYGKNSERWDAEQDLYQYSYLGGSGRFIIVKQGSTLVPVITESDTNDKINITYNSSTYEITQFEIIDTKGYKYIFVEHNENRIVSYTSTTSQFGNSSSATGDYMGNNDVPNVWYIKRIEQPDGTDLCNFSYQNVEENYDTPYTSTGNLVQGNPGYGATIEIQNTNKAMLLPRWVFSNQTITSTQKYVNEVTFRDGSKVKYNLDGNGHPEYGGALNSGIPGGKLNSIQLFDRDGVENKKIEFTYQTTSNNRMFLTEVKEVFGTENLIYTIAYNNKNELPAFDDDHQDVWGYYNGPNSDNPYAVISMAEPEKATTGVISSITYPTGGKKEFVFESNSFGYEGATQVAVATIPENRNPLTRVGSLTIDIQTQVSSGAYLMYVDEGQKIKINSSIASSGSGADASKHRFRFHEAEPKPGVTITPPSNGTVNYNNYNLNDFQYDTNGTVKEFDLVNTNTMSSLAAGWYFIELITPQVALNPNPTFINVDFTINHSIFFLNTTSKKGGGIRIKEILFTDEGVEKRKVEYVYMDNPHIGVFGIATPQERISSGSFEVNPNSRSYTKGKIHPFVFSMVCWGGEGGPGGAVNRQPTLINYTVTRDISAIYTPNTKGNYVGYKYVLRKESGNGSELFTYDSPREIQIQTGTGVATYPFKPQENLDYQRGVLKKREVFLEKEPLETTPKVLQEEVYDYFNVSSVVATSLMTYEAQSYSCPWNQFYDTFYQYQNQIVVHPFEPCGPATTDNDVGTCYNGPNGDNPDMTSTTYNHRKGIMLPKEVIKKQFYYNSTGSLSHTVESTDKMLYNSKNRISEKTSEFDEGGTLITLKQKTFYPYNEPSTEFTSAERLVFDAMEAKNIIEVPVYLESYRNTDLLAKTKTIFDEVSTNNFQPINVEAYKASETVPNEIDFTSYDSFGNLREVSKPDGTQVVYIWGYDQTVPVAKIENATYAQVASYVANIQTKSNDDDDRTIDTVSSSDVITYVGNEGALRQALQSLRSGLPNAMVTTFTYDPMVGVTSMTDPRGQTVYYHYDNFHRLESIKDAYGKIVSENTYHYKN